MRARVSLSNFREEISIKDIIGIIAGTAILSLGIQAVLVPAHILTGGLTGLAVILSFLTRVDISLWYLGLNIPVFIAGYRYISRRFIIYSFLGVAFQSLFLELFKNLNIGIENLLLSAVFGGVLTGLGIGLVLRSKGSTGGTDIIAVIVRRFWGHNFGQTYLLTNLAILALFLFTASLELTLYSVISIYISSQMVDLVEAGPYVTRTVFIISKEYEEITHVIIHTLHRGCTNLAGIGAYTGEELQIIMATVGKTQLPRLKEIVFQIDPEAFMTISETIEVYGRGFRDSQVDF
jgi:uncharacterized membrane-anchored protein YitT (DUF2179 family)